MTVILLGIATDVRGWVEADGGRDDTRARLLMLEQEAEETRGCSPNRPVSTSSSRP
jgi:hypothetical protein